MDFEFLFEQAKKGDENAQNELFSMYRSLLIKNAIEKGIFDEDLYQELSKTLLICIQKFKI